MVNRSNPDTAPACIAARRVMQAWCALSVVWMACGCATKDQLLSARDLPEELQATSMVRLAAADAPATDVDAAVVPAGYEEPGPLAATQGRPVILVNGLVRKPGTQEFPEGRDFRVLEAITRAEGLSNKVVDTVIVCRKRPGRSDRALIKVSLHEACRHDDENILLAPDDIVSVEPTARGLLRDASTYVGAAAGVGGGALMGLP